MGKHIKKFSLIISTVLVAIILSTTAVFAYFVVESGWLSTPNITITAEGEIVEIASEYQLRKWATSDKYNSNELTSELSSRHTIKFVGDISLSKDVTIERDCNVDLNGYTLSLGESNLIFRHDFASKMMVFDSAETKGTITGTGKIIFRTPNTIVDIEESLSAFANVVEYNAEVLADDIIDLAFSRIKDCVRADGSLIGYYKNDIEFIQTYKHYQDLELIWTVENADATDTNVYVTSFGELVMMPTETTILNIKLQIKKGDTLLQKEGVKQIALVPDSAMADRVEVAKNHITTVLEKIKNGEDYFLVNDLALPKSLEYYGITFEYIADSNCLTENEKDFVISRPYSADTIQLTVKYLVDGIDANSDDIFTIICKSKQDNSEKIEQLFDKLGVLLIKNKDTTCPLWTSELLASYGVVGVTYRFVETVQNQGVTEDIPVDYYGVRDVNGTPAIIGGDQEIFVNSLPNSAKKIYIIPTITFESGEPIEVSNRKVQVHHVTDSAGGDESGDDPFAYYYKQVEDLLAEATHLGETYLSFLMPNKILDTVYVQYSLVENVDNLVLQTDEVSTHFNIDTDNLSVDNTNVGILFKFAWVERDQDGNFVTPKWDEIPYYGQIKDDNTGNISGEAKYYPFVMSGIIRNNAEGIVDTVLYETILALYSPPLETHPIDPNGEVLTRNEVSAEKDVFAVDGKNTIQTYSGIQYLTNTNQFVSNNSNFQNADFQYLVSLKKMTNITIHFGAIDKDCLSYIQALDQVKVLDLSCNNLARLSDLTGLNNIEILTLSNCGLDNLEIFRYMFGLNTLDVSNQVGQTSYPNQIKSFRPLMDVANLKTVYLQNITFANDTQNYWGSTGRVNTSVLVMLAYKRGVQVYNTSETTPFVPNNDQITATNVVESFVYVGKITLKQNQNTIQMPTILDGRTLNWVCLSDNNTVSASNGVLTFGSPLTAGRMELMATIQVGNEVIGRLVTIDFVEEGAV